MAIAAAGVAPALAAGLSASQAAPTALRAAREVGKQTHSASVRVLACRQSGARVLCHAEARYRAGARRCTFDVTISRPAPGTRLLRATPSNFVCY